jgi:hypothetical protein
VGLWSGQVPEWRVVLGLFSHFFNCDSAQRM